MTLLTFEAAFLRDPDNLALRDATFRLRDDLQSGELHDVKPVDLVSVMTDPRFVNVNAAQLFSGMAFPEGVPGYVQDILHTGAVDLTVGDLRQELALRGIDFGLFPKRIEPQIEANMLGPERIAKLKQTIGPDNTVPGLMELMELDIIPMRFFTPLYRNRISPNDIRVLGDIPDDVLLSLTNFGKKSMSTIREILRNLPPLDDPELTPEQKPRSIITLASTQTIKDIGRNLSFDLEDAIELFNLTGIRTIEQLAQMDPNDLSAMFDRIIEEERQERFGNAGYYERLRLLPELLLDKMKNQR